MSLIQQICQIQTFLLGRKKYCIYFSVYVCVYKIRIQTNFLNHTFFFYCTTVLLSLHRGILYLPFTCTLVFTMLPLFAGSVGRLHGRPTTKREASYWKCGTAERLSPSPEITEADLYVLLKKLQANYYICLFCFFISILWVNESRTFCCFFFCFAWCLMKGMIDNR